MAEMAIMIFVLAAMAVTDRSVTISNVVPRRDVAGNIINAHAGGIYNFSGTLFLLS
jgi:hypothetical protein